MTHSSFHKIIFRNSIANTLRYFVNYAIIFVLTPIIITKIGDAQYGLWALMFSLIGYAGFLDLGVQQATIKLVAEYKGKDDVDRLNSIISTTLLYFLCIGVFVALLCWFVLPYVMHLFVEDIMLLSLSVNLLYIFGIDVIFCFLVNVFTGVALGLHQYHFKSIVDIFCGVGRFFSTIYVLNAGYGLLGLAWINLALNIIATILLYISCVFINFKISISLKNVTLVSLKEIFSFGSKIFLATTSTRINSHTTIILVSYFLTTTMTAYYNVANRLIGSAQEVLWSLTASLFPVFSELSSKNSKNEVLDYYLQYTRYFLLLTIPVALGLIFFGTPFISLWISDEYAQGTRIVLVLLSFGVLIAAFQPLSTRVLIGSGNVTYVTKITVAKNIGALIFSIPLIMTFGLAGPPLAMLVAEFIYQLFLFLYILKFFEMKLSYCMRLCYVPIVLPMISSVIFFKIMSYLLSSERIAFAFIVFNVYLFVYLFLSMRYSLNSKERCVIFSFLKLHFFRN